METIEAKYNATPTMFITKEHHLAARLLARVGDADCVVMKQTKDGELPYDYKRFTAVLGCEIGPSTDSYLGRCLIASPGVFVPNYAVQYSNLLVIICLMARYSAGYKYHRIPWNVSVPNIRSYISADKENRFNKYDVSAFCIPTFWTVNNKVQLASLNIGVVAFVTNEVLMDADAVIVKALADAAKKELEDEEDDAEDQYYKALSEVPSADAMRKMRKGKNKEIVADVEEDGPDGGKLYDPDNLEAANTNQLFE